jgi:SAM-dependent methyltransferase
MSEHAALDAFAEEDFDEDMLESVTLAGKATGISHEFVQYQVRGLEPFCWSPWRMLKVDIRSRTMVCCNFAHKLPEFEWPSARDFHKETGMWNHPFMQHMRAGMGKASELPYCTLCRTKDKRDPKNFALRERAMKETQLLFERIVEAISPSCEAIPEKLTEWAHSLRPSGAAIKLFAKERIYYRRIVRTRRFHGLERVLQVGSWNGTITPFLAEKNHDLTVLDDSPRRLAKVNEVTRAFALNNVTTIQTENYCALPFASQSFDGVWLDGRLLSRLGRAVMLQEAFRLLAPGGRLQVNQGLGPAGLVEAASNGTIDVAIASAALRRGPAYDGPGAFLTSATVLAAVKLTGFVSDRANPPAVTRLGENAEMPSMQDADFAALAAEVNEPSFLQWVRTDSTRLKGLDRFISFTLIKPA